MATLKKPSIYESNYIKMLLGKLLCNRKQFLAHISPYENIKNQHQIKLKKNRRLLSHLEVLVLWPSPHILDITPED